MEVEIAQSDYKRSLREGATTEDAMKPGKHTFRRFRDRHPAEGFEEPAKVKVTIWLDAEVVAYFKKRAAEPNAAPYQTQINNELKGVMQSEEAAFQPLGKSLVFDALVNNAEFLEAITERVSKRLKQ